MRPFLKLSHKTPRTSLTFYSHLIDHCISSKSSSFSKIVHAQLIKVGFNKHTFLGNRCLDLYTKFGSVVDIFRVFDEISSKNVVSWNVCLKGLLKLGRFELARKVFDKMPQRDVVSWNSMVSGCCSFGRFESALEVFQGMGIAGVRPSGHTHSILLSVVWSELQGKEVHGSMIRRGFIGLNTILANSLIDMYGKIGVVDYAIGVFLTMDELDVISWNSLFIVCSRHGCETLAFSQFSLMRSSGYAPDEFSYSALMTCCSNSQNLDMGKQIVALCVKDGYILNTIILSAAIDLFSKCNRLEDAVQLFEHLDRWDSAVCNSMLSSYAWHGLGDDALRLLVLTLREDIKPTEFTFSSVLSSICSLPMEQGTQVHSLVFKTGFEVDKIVASSILDRYFKFGSVEDAMKIFKEMIVPDLISWNTLIIGLTPSGYISEALKAFKELLKTGLKLDRITLTGVLSACSYGGLIDEGITIFALMEEHYGIKPSREHYACLVDLLCLAGRLDEAIDIVKRMPCQASSSIWRSILSSCLNLGEVKHAEIAAKKLQNLEPNALLPYLVLVRMYEMRGQWEDVVRVRKAMKMSKVKKETECSWIGIQSQVYTFAADQLQHPGGKHIYLVLRLLNWEMGD